MAVSHVQEPALLPRGGSTRGVNYALTRRERQVLRELSNGATNREIAAQLGVSVHTVKSYVKTILLKLGARNRTAAAISFERFHDHSGPGQPTGRPD